MDTSGRATPTEPSVLARARAEIEPYRRPIAWGALLALVWAGWASGPGWTTPALAVVAVAGVALGVIDARTHRLPNAIVYPMTLAVAVLLTLAALASGDLGALGRSLAGGVVLAAVFWLLHAVNRSGLGLGDVKLSLSLGALSAWYGWHVLWATALLPFLVGGVVAVALLVTRRADRKTAIAFGPYMLVGAALAITWARVVGS